MSSVFVILAISGPPRHQFFIPLSASSPKDLKILPIPRKIAGLNASFVSDGLTSFRVPIRKKILDLYQQTSLLLRLLKDRPPLYDQARHTCLQILPIALSNEHNDQPKNQLAFC